MSEKLNLSEILEMNINLLIGSGASYGLFPTLALGMVGEDDETVTVETLANQFESASDIHKTSALFMHYYKSCIEPVIRFDIDEAKDGGKKEDVIKNYSKFLITLLNVIERKKMNKRCNIFTTNYDGCFPMVANELLKGGARNFIVNDGTRGFMQRYLHAMNFDTYARQSGMFEKRSVEIPQINLINLHGSIYWYKNGEQIEVDYSKRYHSRIIEIDYGKITSFSKDILDNSKKIEDLGAVVIDEGVQKKFWEKYNELPIVNPRRWKFHETVFEEHYYQMLRYLSYELEKKDSILLTFGFSFADQHIRNLVMRSLGNPSLQVYICCFNSAEEKRLRKYFESFKNVKYLTSESQMTFTEFNQVVFNLDSPGIPKTLDASGSAI